MRSRQRRKTLVKIKDLQTDEVGEVLDLLSEQFTALMNKKVRYYFFKDRMVTWEEVRT